MCFKKLHAMHFEWFAMKIMWCKTHFVGHIKFVHRGLNVSNLIPAKRILRRICDDKVAHERVRWLSPRLRSTKVKWQQSPQLRRWRISSSFCSRCSAWSKLSRFDWNVSVPAVRKNRKNVGSVKRFGNLSPFWGAVVWWAYSSCMLPYASFG